MNGGGWLEMQDIDFPLRSDDGTLPSDSPMKQWCDLMVQAGEASGFLLTTCGDAARLMGEAGFVDITRVPFKWPINSWPREEKYKRIGWYAEVNFCMGIEAMTLALFTRFLGWTREAVLEFVERVRADFRDTSKHAYFDLYVTYGRKP
jgi:hypothetical protein